MPTPAEWIFIAFVVGVIFAVHRLRTMGDALGGLLGGSSQRPDTDEPNKSEPPPDAS